MAFNLRRNFFLLLLLLATATGANAQLIPGLTGKPAAEETVEAPKDLLGRRTPRGTVDGFISAIGQSNYLEASQYLQLNKKKWRRQSERIRIVTVIQKHLDQSGDIQPYGFISNKETGRTDDEFEEGNDLIGTITAGGQTINLMVANTAGANEPALWLISAETVDEIMNISGDNDVLLNRVLPDVLKERRMGGVPIGHWFAVVIFILVAYLLSWAIVSLISYILRLIWRRSEDGKVASVIRAFELPFRLYLAVWIFVAVSQEAGISIIVRQRFSVITVTIGIVAILMLLWRITDVITVYTNDRMTKRKRVSAISIIMFLRRTSKVALVVIGIIAVLGALGVDVTAGLAALGIGGIALALGAQKTMENFVGSVTLIADQPIRVGDYCKIGEIKGTVESIGMRSTRLRTSARTIVTIPNGEFSSSKIENYAHRDRFLFAPIFYFRMETTPDQLRFLLVELRALLYAHPKILDTPIVRFTGITENSYKVEVTAYIEAPSLDPSQEIQEDVLLHIMDVVAKSGTDFAYPSQTLYLAGDTGISKELTEEVGETVKNWRTNKEMQLPSFDPAYAKSLKGTIPYPPEGSVVKNEDQH